MDISSSSRLTLYHDGQFWIGLFEINDEDGYSVCRTVFGTEPADEEILQSICKRWTTLPFSPPIEDETPPKSPAQNPKRRQREAAKELLRLAASTKAQAALSAQRENGKSESKAALRKQRQEEVLRRFNLRQKKLKQKKRGH